jgi:uncharacterized SAM-binding protein YcdF (DUF218 family)
VRRKLITVALVAGVVGVAGGLLHQPLFGAIGSYLVRNDALRNADIGLVLAGDASGNRILKAGELVREGYIPHVLVSGPSGMYGFHECDLAIPFAEHAGYPASYFEHVEHDARSTAEEAVATIRAVRKTAAHRVMLITSDYHTRRAGRIFRRTAPDLEFVVVAAPDLEFSPDGWWRTRQGRKVALYEWLKTAADWFGI